MLSNQEDQGERRRVLANDARVREQSGTFFSHTHMDEGGRFAQVSNAQIVGADPIPNYPAASAAHQIQLPDEPPLGFDNPALENSTVACPVEAQPGGPAEAPATTSVSPGQLSDKHAAGPSPRQPFREF
jgi:hypothetical protein